MRADVQDLSQFRLPAGFRGRSALVVQLWWAVQSTLFRLSPQVAYPFRRWLLRLFGARIGKAVQIRPTADITYPWKLEIGDGCWIGDEVVLYTLGSITIGKNSVISQRSYICAADHDMTAVDFPIRARPVSIGSEVWIATDVFVAPGVSIADGAVVAARSSVFSDMPAYQLCVGTPCRPLRPRPRSTPVAAA
jgi:putative colanic acid biosynthesis acetyltransferase WcaF